MVEGERLSSGRSRRERKPVDYTSERVEQAHASKPQGKGRRDGGGPRRDGGGKGKGKAQNFSARPPKQEKKIDPDNPFAAALMGLKDDK